MPILTLVDTLGIQSFVFASSRLQDVTGGSWQVMQASKKDLLWVQDCVKDPEDILIGGGGNVMLQFASLSEAQQFAKLYSRKILNKAPGLEVAIVHQEYAQGQLAYGIRCAQIAIEREKLERVPQVPVLGLGVTATCRDTRLPAHSWTKITSLSLKACISVANTETNRKHGGVGLCQTAGSLSPMEMGRACD